MRYFVIVVVVFVLFWGIRGIVRRMFGTMLTGKVNSHRTQSQRRAPGRAAKPVESRTPPKRTPTLVDYTKIRDARYRDLG